MAVAAAVLVAGGGLAYFRTGQLRPHRDSPPTLNGKGAENLSETSANHSKDLSSKKKKKRGGIKNVKVLAALLYQRIGKGGMNELVALGIISVSVSIFKAFSIAALGSDVWKSFLTQLGISAGLQNSVKQQTCESTGLAVPCCLFNKGSSFHATHNGELASLLSSIRFLVDYKVSHWSFVFAISKDSYKSHSFRLLSGNHEIFKWVQIIEVARRELAFRTSTRDAIVEVVVVLYRTR